MVPDGSPGIHDPTAPLRIAHVATLVSEYRPESRGSPSLRRFHPACPRSPDDSHADDYGPRRRPSTAASRP